MCRGTRVMRVLEENALLVVLLAFIAALACFLLAPVLIVADTWLTLAAGRELAENGLPSVDEWTVFGAGSTWTDQQWLAQLVFYGAERLGGLALAAALATLLLVLTFAFSFAAARTRGASARATLAIALFCIFAAPWTWQVRAQSLALPLFAGVLWLLVDARDGLRPRTWLVIPLLVVWANVHGSVVLGTVLAMLLAVTLLVRRAGATRSTIALLVLAPLTVLATPYGPADTIDYYHLLLVDPPFGDLITEWKWSRPRGTTAIFYLLTAVWLMLALWKRRSLTLFEHLTLLLTLAGAVAAVRGIVWFSIACLVLLPVCLDAALPRREQRVRRGLNRVLAVGAVAVIAVGLVSLVARGDDWLNDEWPEGVISLTAAAAARDSELRVYSADRYANWLLWRVPELRGRVAYDVRFELLTREQIEDLVRFNARIGDDWADVADGFQILVLDDRKHRPQSEELASEPFAFVGHDDGRAIVVVR